MVPKRTCCALLVIMTCASLATARISSAQSTVMQSRAVQSYEAGLPPALPGIPRTDIAPSSDRLAEPLATDVAGLPRANVVHRPYHYFQRADMPPGSIGQAQLMRGGPLPGYYQSVEISAPQDTHLALAMEGIFETPQPAPLKAGLLIGSVYRLKVTNIPFNPGQEVFPSIEIINRLYPPQGSEVRFPIPIQLTREELELAVRGHFVIRVIYLENPRTALPRREDPMHQRYFEVGPGQDPLEVADGLGRPMAILRMGSRVPELDETTGRFLFASPPWIRFPEVWMDEPNAVPVPPSPAPQDPTAGLETGVGTGMVTRTGTGTGTGKPSGTATAKEEYWTPTNAQTRQAGVGVKR